MLHHCRPPPASASPPRANVSRRLETSDTPGRAFYKTRMIRPALLALLLLTVFAAPARADAIKLEYARIPLSGFDPEIKGVGKLRYRGGLQLRSVNPDFGGFSSLLVSPDGSRILTVSDRARWLRARLTYSNGRLTGIGKATMGPIRGHKGAILGRTRSDSESLARDRRGRTYISFERVHRVVGYAAKDRNFRRGRRLPRPPGAEKAPRNGGLEALTALADGRLLAISEDNRLRPSTLRAWIGDGRRWRALTYGKTAGYQPTGAATLPNGDVLVLERHYRPPFYLAVRIARIPKRLLKPGARLTTKTVALLDSRVAIDNFEGIAVRKSRAGKTLVYLISDDNFNPIQRTYLLMFELVE